MRDLVIARFGRTPASGVEKNDPDRLQIPDSEVPRSLFQALARCVGERRVSTDRMDRIRHAVGQSYLDLIKLRRGELETVPDVVVYPGSHDEVVHVLAVCAKEEATVIPFGGGTSVVGGVNTRPGKHPTVVLDMARMNRLIAVDTVSLTATLGAGMRGPEVAATLLPHGLTLGHLPQSFEFSTVGGWVATRSAGQASTGFGRADQLVRGLRCATPIGELQLGRGPWSAAGPRLLDLIVGSEGAFGVITEVTFEVYPLPERQRYEAWSFPSFAQGITALRMLMRELGPGMAPDVCRLSDPDETAITLALSRNTWATRVARAYLNLRGHGSSCVAILGWEGSVHQIIWRHRHAMALLRRHGAVPLGSGPARSWQRQRFVAPALRDTLLDHGLLVETVETAAYWSDLPRVYEAVREAVLAELRPWRPLVLAHLSHLYRTGASLYFTILARRDDDDPIGQWTRAKHAVSQAIAEQGATITHHHGIGSDHAPWMEAEVGQVGVTALRALKAAVDPDRLLNPGVLIPDEADDGQQTTGETED